MFLILKTTDWKEEDYVKNGIVPFSCRCEEISKCKTVVQV